MSVPRGPSDKYIHVSDQAAEYNLNATLKYKAEQMSYFNRISTAKVHARKTLETSNYDFPLPMRYDWDMQVLRRNQFYKFQHLIFYDTFPLLLISFVGARFMTTARAIKSCLSAANGLL
jgi:hypothetical protein